MYRLTTALNARPSAEVWDLVSGLLYQFHSHGIEEGEEPAPQGAAALVEANEFELALEPGVLAPPEKFSAYFENRRDAERAQRAIEPVLSPLTAAFSIDEVEEQDYVALWKENLHPIRTPPSWLIRAPWHTEKEKKDEKLLIIEPGMAFGTGSHETTRACLELLPEACASVRPTPKVGGHALRLLDFGCGSGILAVAMKRLGNAEVFGVDIDPLALEATHRNAALNGVDVQTSLHAREFSGLDGIVANILKNTLLEFAPKFHAWLRPGGFLILSGLLLEQEEVICELYLRLGFRVEKRLTHGEWVTLWLKRASARV